MNKMNGNRVLDDADPAFGTVKKKWRYKASIDIGPGGCGSGGLVSRHQGTEGQLDKKQAHYDPGKCFQSGIIHSIFFFNEQLQSKPEGITDQNASQDKMHGQFGGLHINSI